MLHEKQYSECFGYTLLPMRTQCAHQSLLSNCSKNAIFHTLALPCQMSPLTSVGGGVYEHWLVLTLASILGKSKNIDPNLIKIDHI